MQTIQPALFRRTAIKSILSIKVRSVGKALDRRAMSVVGNDAQLSAVADSNNANDSAGLNRNDWIAHHPVICFEAAVALAVLLATCYVALAA